MSDGIIVIRGREENNIGESWPFEVRVDGLLWENAEENVIEIKPESVIWVDGREDIPKTMLWLNLSGILDESKSGKI